MASSPTTGPTKVRIGLLPIIDSVPFYAAEEDGLFEEAGLDVELVTFASALERNVALQAGEIDGQLADLIATGLLNQNEHLVTIVKTTYRSNDQLAMTSLVAGAESGIDSPDDLTGKDVAISHNSLIEYHLDRMLEDAGVDPAGVEKTEVASIPVRMDLLSQNQVPAAILVEPLTTLALQSGARVILDDKESRLGLSVLEFKTSYLDENAEAVRKVVAVHDEAVRRINADPEKYRHLLSEKARLPEVLKDTFQMPPFPETDVPAQAEVEQASAWMVEKDLIPQARPYQEVVDESFLPAGASSGSSPTPSSNEPQY
jgi:NitT/TauT family transport system substrate-binding protein